MFEKLTTLIRNIFTAKINAAYVEEIQINEKLNGVLKANSLLVDGLNAKIKSLETRLYSQIQALKEEHQRLIDAAIIQYEGKVPKQNGCACHDRSCCIAGRCSRPVRYRAHDGQGFCGMCFCKRNTKEFVDLCPIKSPQIRRTATVLPVLEESLERTDKGMITKNNFNESAKP